MKTKKELTIYDVENWAKEVEKFPTRQLTEEEAKKFLMFQWQRNELKMMKN